MKGSKTAALVVVLIAIAVIIAVKGSSGKRAEPDSSAAVGASLPASAGSPSAPESAGPTGGAAEGATGQKAVVSAPEAEPGASASKPPKPSDGKSASTSGKSKALPKMLELGSEGCIPCEHMAPIIEDLKQELKGKVDIRFYDVRENPDIADRYQVMTIPTQVFLDSDGRELFRHIGVFEKEEILAKMRELKMLSD